MSKKVGQIVILVVLLGVLAVSLTLMIRSQMPKRRSTPTPAAPTATQQAAETGQAEARPATGSAGGATSVPGKTEELQVANLNPNLFKVFALKPPKNPFVPQEEWYEDDLSKLPGYPEMRDSDYLESMDAFLPDIDFIFDGEKEWQSISIQRRRDNKYSFTGISEDGQIQTQIDLVEDIPVDSAYTWTAASGDPISRMKDAEWVKGRIEAQEDRYTPPAGGGLPVDLFDGALPPPGSVAVPDLYSDQLGGAESRLPSGDTVICQGVNISDSRSSALLIFNGQVKLVTKGTLLAPRYKVMEIKPDGVVLQQLIDGSSEWVPLKGSPQGTDA